MTAGNNEIADVLERAADKVSPEGTWTQDEFARDETGKPLAGGWSAGAACWCAMGAVEAVLGRKAASAGLALYIDFVETAARTPSLVAWNDAPGRTQAEVVAALRDAAALARTSGEVS